MTHEHVATRVVRDHADLLKKRRKDTRSLSLCV